MVCCHRLHGAVYRLCPNSPEPTLRPSLSAHVLGTQDYLCSPAPTTQKVNACHSLLPHYDIGRDLPVANMHPPHEQLPRSPLGTEELVVPRFPSPGFLRPLPLWCDWIFRNPPVLGRPRRPHEADKDSKCCYKGVALLGAGCLSRRGPDLASGLPGCSSPPPTTTHHTAHTPHSVQPDRTHSGPL